MCLLFLCNVSVCFPNAFFCLRQSVTQKKKHRDLGTNAYYAAERCHMVNESLRLWTRIEQNKSLALMWEGITVGHAKYAEGYRNLPQKMYANAEYCKSQMQQFIGKYSKTIKKHQQGHSF